MKKVSLLLALVLALSLALSCAVAEDAAPALLAYYTFDDAENLGADASGNGNDLVTAINPDGISATEGYAGGAVYFGGASGLLVKDQDNNDMIDTYAGKGLTISVWCKVDMENSDDSGWGHRVIGHGVQGATEGFAMLVNKFTAEDGTAGITAYGSVGGSAWADGWVQSVEGDPAAWHHYVMVYDPDAELVTIFVDGVKTCEAYADAEEVISSPFTFCVGGNWARWDWFNGGNFEETDEGFIGSVDEVKIFAGALYDLDAIAAAK